MKICGVTANDYLKAPAYTHTFRGHKTYSADRTIRGIKSFAATGTAAFAEGAGLQARKSACCSKCGALFWQGCQLALQPFHLAESSTDSRCCLQRVEADTGLISVKACFGDCVRYHQKAPKDADLLEHSTEARLDAGNVEHRPFILAIPWFFDDILTLDLTYATSGTCRH